MLIYSENSYVKLKEKLTNSQGYIKMLVSINLSSNGHGLYKFAGVKEML